jgi:hypothetical protein
MADRSIPPGVPPPIGEFKGYTDDQLIASAREHALAGLLMCVGIKEDVVVSNRVHRLFQDVLRAIDEHDQAKASPVTPQALGQDLLNACELEGWDTTLLFWDEGRYDKNDDEIPSRIAADIAARLLECYEMKPRT